MIPPRSSTGAPLDARVVDAAVCGFDLSGFSAWVEEMITADGGRALEAIADRLDAMFCVAFDLLAGHGFAVEGLLGDGLVAVGPAGLDAARLDTVAASLTRGLAERRFGEPMRVAAAAGEVVIAELGGWNGRRLRLLTGPAITAYHAKLQAQARPPHTWSPAAAELRATKLYDAEISSRWFLFGRLTEAGDLGAVHRLTHTAQAEADACGGACEAATHDDRGLMLRFAFSTPAGAQAMAEALPRLAERQGLACALGQASGPAFRARLTALATPTWTVHGAAVNAAARLAKSSQPSGDLTPTNVRAPAPLPEPSMARAADLSRLTRALEDGHRLIEVVGDPGMGKTHLLGRLAARLGPGAVRLAAHPQHSLDPYWIWGRLLERVLGGERDRILSTAGLSSDQRTALIRLLAPEDETAPLPSESALALTGDALVRVIQVQSTVTHLLIDDLQWADGPSVSLIDRALASCPRITVVAARRAYVEAAAADLPASECLRLDGVPAKDLAAILHAAGWRGSATDLDSAVRITGGNPLFATQLAWARRDGARSEVANLAALVEARLDRATPDERAILRVLAVARRALETQDIQALVEAGGVTASTPQLESLRARALLSAEGGTFQVTHQLLAEHIRAGLPPSLVAPLHIQAARRLSAAARQGRLRLGRGELAGLWRAAKRPGRAGLGHLADAQASLEDGDYGAALTLFDAALVDLPDLDGTRGALLFAGRGMARWARGFVALAADDARAALAAVDRSLPAGRAGRWLAILRGRQCGLRPRARLALLRASVVRAEAGLFAGDLGGIASGCVASLRLGADAQDQAIAQSRGLAFLGLTCGLARLPRLARLAYDRAQAVTDEKAQAYACASEAVWRLAFGRWREARAVLDEADRRLGDRVDQHLREAMLTLRALSAQLQGDYAQAAEDFASLASANRAGGNQLHEAWGLYGQAMPLVRLGLHAEALRLVDLATSRLADLGDGQSLLICHGLRAQAALAAGRRDEALGAIEAAIALAPFPTNFGSFEGFAGPAEAAAALGRDPLATPAQRGRANRALPAALRALRGYARIFPIGRARLRALEASLRPPPRLAGRHAAQGNLAG
jgi:tetratricopeptide (TPR) repeat protein